MKIEIAREVFDWLRAADEEEVRRIVGAMTLADVRIICSMFELWAHESQLPPPGDHWRAWLLMAGRGFGKTRAGAEWVHRNAVKRPGLRIALVGANIGDARSIMVEGVSGLLAVAELRQCRLTWEPSLGRITWPNGSEASLFSGDQADGLRGPEFDLAWYLTFELVADEPVTVGGILNDASGEAIACGDTTAVGGYAAMGSSIGAAIDPLVTSFGIDLVDDGEALRSPSVADPISLNRDDLGCAIDEKSAARIDREQAPARSLPASVLLSYYDRERDYQTGQSRSDLVDRVATEEKIELPAVVDARDARALAEQLLARRWAQRDKLTLRLPPAFMELQPGRTIEVPQSGTAWQVTRSTIDGMVTVLELRPQCSIQPMVDADGGRALAADDTVLEDIALAVVELPDLSGRSTISPTLYLAASTAASAWKRLPVEIAGDAFAFGSRTAARKAVMGDASTVLAAGPADELDATNSVEVELVDPAQWLVSCDDEALTAGANLALIGDEILQFADAESIGSGRFRLSRFLRGRYATAVSAHAIGEMFLLIDPATLQSIHLPSSSQGSVVTATCRTPASTSTASRLVDGRSLPRGVFVDGEQVVGSRADSIPSPVGGVTVDAEARDAVSQILSALRTHGLIDT